ncbi:3',5'-cyclic-nucleotide phosphodiesterase [Pararobbsia alpina]|uniref:Ribonuclease BN n=1 Tax=Pararobbsia alpina TaxID=621374 RepID=A0A6S7BSR5_9BURK|nr:3',5'-cyclic-nucleotide phosphodiesterase [Pararobbsia alpina]CAB3793861.1 Ribonuclease BN [Pararobbsia alpina]
MKVTVLGCSGGIDGAEARTTALLIDDDVLVDAGTGVGDLDCDALARIDRVFVTHAHIDHIAFLPLMIDAVGALRSVPLVVHCTRATEAILRAHLFNDALWPDFSRIPSPAKPYFRFKSMEVGESCTLDHSTHGPRSLTALPANHTTPAVGYRLDGPSGSLAFSGDTTLCPEFWQALAQIPTLRYLIVETAFPDSQRDLAIASKHLCPSMLAAQLPSLSASFELFIAHLKPGHEDLTMSELEASIRLTPNKLARGDVFEF